MVKNIETITNDAELAAVCRKHRLMPVPQPTMLLTRVAEILYEAQANEGKKFAVCTGARFDLVEYESEDELIAFAKNGGYDGVALVNKNGSGMMIPRRFF